MTKVENTQDLGRAAISEEMRRVAETPIGETVVARQMPRTLSGAPRFASRMDGMDAAEVIRVEPKPAEQ